MSETNLAIDVNGLTKRYRKDDPPAVDGLSLQINKGEIFGFVGPNGAGKTTTLKMLLNMVCPDAGGGRILGFDICRESVQIRRRVSFMSGEVRLYNYLTGRQTLALFQEFHQGGNPQKLEDLMGRFNVPMDRRVKTYSTGQKQQLALILALAHDADVLIMDEPTVGLDPSKKKTFLDLIEERGKRGAAVIISSHVLSEIESICTRVGFIRDGVLLGHDEIDSVRKKLGRLVVASFEREMSEQELLFKGVRKIHRSGQDYVFHVDGDGREVIKHLADMPLASLRYRAASLDDIYESLYMNAGHDDSADDTRQGEGGDA